MIDFTDVWTHIKENWHKYGVVLLILFHGWKYFYDYIRPAVAKEHQELSIKIPTEGCTIIIKPLDPEE
jgi:hypothetical protein